MVDCVFMVLSLPGLVFVCVGILFLRSLFCHEDDSWMCDLFPPRQFFIRAYFTEKGQHVEFL